jgi:hypothetical protein
VVAKSRRWKSERRFYTDLNLCRLRISSREQLVLAMALPNCRPGKLAYLGQTLIPLTLVSLVGRLEL